MNWKRERSGMTATSTDDQLYFMVIAKKNGKFFVKAYLSGGADHRLRFQDFDSEQEAMDWVEDYEAKRETRNARIRNEKPIRF